VLNSKHTTKAKKRILLLEAPKGHKQRGKLNILARGEGAQLLADILNSK